MYVCTACASLQDVLGLQVSVYDVGAVQGIQGHRDLRRVEAGAGLGKLPVARLPTKGHRGPITGKISRGAYYAIHCTHSTQYKAHSTQGAPVLLEPEEELSPGHVVQDHVELVGGLECIYEMHQEGAVDVLQDGALGGRVRQLVSLHQGSFP